MLKVADIWRELVDVLAAPEHERLAEFLQTLESRKLHPLFQSAIDAQVAFSQGQTEAAIERLNLEANERELGPHERLVRGLALLTTGEPDEALVDLREARKAGLNSDPRLDSAIASIAMARGDNAPAERFYMRTLQKDPRQWRERFMLAMVQRRVGKVAESLAQATRVTEDAPDFESGWLLRAALMVDAGETEAAVELVVPVARLHTDWIRLRVGVVDCLRANGQLDAAIGTLAPIAIQQNDPHLVMDLLEMFLVKGDLDAAEGLFDVIEALGFDSARVSFLRGCLAEAQGSDLFEVAQAYYEVSIEQDPNSWQAYDGLASLLSQDTPSQDLAAAEKLYQHAANSPTYPVRPALNLALLYADIERMDAAQNIIDSILERPLLTAIDRYQVEQAKEMLDAMANT